MGWLVVSILMCGPHHLFMACGQWGWPSRLLILLEKCTWAPSQQPWLCWEVVWGHCPQPGEQGQGHAKTIDLKLFSKEHTKMIISWPHRHFNQNQPSLIIGILKIFTRLGSNWLWLLKYLASLEYSEEETATDHGDIFRSKYSQNVLSKSKNFTSVQSSGNSFLHCTLNSTLHTVGSQLTLINLNK